MHPNSWMTRKGGETQARSYTCSFTIFTQSDVQYEIQKQWLKKNQERKSKQKQTGYIKQTSKIENDQ